jgi:glycosidase
MKTCLLICLTLSAMLLAACAAPTAPPTALPAPTAMTVPAPTASPTPALAKPVGLDGVLVRGTGGLPWWNDVVFYEVFVRSFYDSNGDGIGDLNGLIQQLDYLNDGNPATTSDLGVTGIWLMPIAQSPSYHGYDVADYNTVDDEYGTNADFRRLMAEAHRRGIYVIVDLVLNHTSKTHPWFLDAQQPDSPRRDWYVWSQEKTTGQGWHQTASGYYYGYFSPDMPDLNYRNPAVTAAMQEVIRYWLAEMGVDGFRLDAVKYLYEDGRQIEHTPATHAWLKEFRTFYKRVRPQAFTVGEVWSDTSLAASYVGAELDTVFDFNLANATLESAVGGRAVNVARAQAAVLAAYPTGQYATFLANHDQNRARSRLLDDEQAKIAASLQLTFGGVPFIYYGEEIGMEGTKPDENIRRPMQWTATGGFTTGAPWREYFKDLAERNVAGQDAAAGSLLNHYRTLLRLRSTHEALRVGDVAPVESADERVHALLRSTANETILVVINLGFKPTAAYTLKLAAGPLAGTPAAALLLGDGRPAAPTVNAVGGFDAYQPLPSLPAHSTTIIRLAP